MSNYISLSIPSLQGNEWKYIKECLETEWVSSAVKYRDLFEEEIADYIGAKYAISCVNGTIALQVALRLAGVGPGDEVRTHAHLYRRGPSMLLSIMAPAPFLWTLKRLLSLLQIKRFSRISSHTTSSRTHESLPLSRCMYSETPHGWMS